MRLHLREAKHIGKQDAAKLFEVNAVNAPYNRESIGFTGRKV